MFELQSYVFRAPVGEMSECNVPGFQPRGLLKLIMQSARVQQLTAFGHPRFHEWVVAIVVAVPDRHTMAWVDIQFGGTYTPRHDHIADGRHPAESVLIQAINDMWKHELDEGLVINGREVNDPEPLHG